MRTAIAIIGLLALAPPAPDPPTAGDLAAGHRLARRLCGECHSLDDRPSPLPGAPRFRALFAGVRAERLDAMLKEGMLATDPPLEEGVPTGHPRMPTFRLGPDERTELRAYLTSLQ